MYIEPDTRNNYVTNFMQIILPFKQSLTILIPGSLMLKISPDKFDSYGKKIFLDLDISNLDLIIL